MKKYNLNTDNPELKLKEIREDAKISISNLSRELGISRTTIYGYESGDVEAPLTYVIKLCNIAKIEVLI